MNLATEILDTLERRRPEVRYTFRKGGEETTLDGPSMATRIREFGAGFREIEEEPGSVVPIIGSSTADIWAAFAGALLADRTPCLMSAPTFKTHLPTYARNLGELLERYGVRTLIVGSTDSELLARAMEEGQVETRLTHLEDLAGATSEAPSPARGADDIAFLQHSSGSTGTPKGVALTHRAVLDHLATYAEALDLDPSTDRIASWLPLYHDMGLLSSYLLPLAHGVDCFTMPPQEWIVDPVEILRVITRERSTLTWWPNFTHSLLAQRARDKDLEGLDLSSLRAVVNCSEPVIAESREAFAARFAAVGARADQLHASYAMAENVFAVTQSSGDGPAEFVAEQTSLEFGEEVRECGADHPRARRTVSSGPAIPAVTLRILDDQGNPLEDGRVGEIALGSPWLFPEYHHLPGLAESVRHEGLHRTGDVGFLRGGELYVLARKTDMLIVAGRKFYPNVIEDIVHEIPYVKAGRAVAFGVRSATKGTEELAVLLESDSHEDRAIAGRIKKEVRKQVMQRIDCPVDHVRVLAPRSLIKTSSGKIARRENRRWFEETILAETRSREAAK